MSKINSIILLAVFLLTISYQQPMITAANRGPPLAPVPSPESIQYMGLNPKIIANKDYEIDNNIQPQRAIVPVDVPIERAVTEDPVLGQEKAQSIAPFIKEKRFDSIVTRDIAANRGKSYKVPKGTIAQFNNSSSMELPEGTILNVPKGTDIVPNGALSLSSSLTFTVTTVAVILIISLSHTSGGNFVY